MDKYIYIIIFKYLKYSDLVKMKDINYVKHPLVWNEYINIWHQHITLSELQGCPVKNLDLTSRTYRGDRFPKSDICDSDIKNICGTHLKSLNLAGTNITDESLKIINKMNLHKLVLNSTNITDDGLKYITNMKLSTLEINRTNITDDGLKYIKNMGLKHLSLIGTDISDIGFDIIKKMGLTGVSLLNTHIASDKASQYVQELDMAYIKKFMDRLDKLY